MKKELSKNPEGRLPSPRSDFFGFVNSEWIKANPIPPDKARWNAVNVLQRQTSLQLAAVCVEAGAELTAPKGSNLQLVGDFYASGMDSEKRNSEGIEPIKDILNEIADLPSHKEAAVMIANLQVAGFSPFFSPSVYKDDTDPDFMALYFSQSGLGMPNRDYYLDNSEGTQTIRDKYQAYMTRVFTLAGVTDTEVASNATQEIFALEKKLAEVQRPKEEVRQVEKNYHPYTPEEASKFSFLSESYLNTLGAGNLDRFIIQQPDYLTKADNIFRTTDIATIKQYLVWNVLNGSVDALGDDFRRAGFDFFGKVVQGITEPEDTSEQVINKMQDRKTILTAALGPLYVERHFSQEAKEGVSVMAEDIRAALMDRVEDREWLDAETKPLVIEKINKVHINVGYPEKWVDLSLLDINREQSYAKNIRNLHEFNFARKMSQAGKETDWSEWTLPPIIVNVSTDQKREMTVPAAFLQPPFFDPETDMAYNYGAIGSVIGHDLSHFVDDQGSKFDANGKMNDWWPNSVKEEFDRRKDAFITYFESYSVDDVPVNGVYTLGENIGDVAGVLIAFDAYQKYLERTGERKIINGMTPEQRFFVGAAQIYRGQMRLEERKRRHKTDPHAPGEVRVNATLAIIPAFVKAFGIKEGDDMYVPPETVPELW